MRSADLSRRPCVYCVTRRALARPLPFSYDSPAISCSRIADRVLFPWLKVRVLIRAALAVFIEPNRRSHWMQVTALAVACLRYAGDDSP